MGGVSTLISPGAPGTVFGFPAVCVIKNGARAPAAVANHGGKNGIPPLGFIVGSTGVSGVKVGLGATEGSGVGAGSMD
jgi:hypothetical protein